MTTAGQPSTTGAEGSAGATDLGIGDESELHAAPSPDASEGHVLSVPIFRIQRGHGVGLSSTAPRDVPPDRPTVLARTLALAHRLQGMLDRGRFENRAQLAAQLGFSRARITQIMELLWLAPDIQEEILFSVSRTGRDAVTTRDLRAILRVMEWSEQRQRWLQLCEHELD